MTPPTRHRTVLLRYLVSQPLAALFAVINAGLPVDGVANAEVVVGAVLLLEAL